MRDHDPTDPRSGVPTGTTRRSLVRAAAWSLPVVSISAMAPALAASGLDPGLSVTGQFVIHDWGDGEWGVVPTLTVRNSSLKATASLVVTLTFATAAFGTLTSIINAPAADGTWTITRTGPTDANPAWVYTLTRAGGLGAGQSSWFGSDSPAYNPFSIAWFTQPTVTSIPLTVSGDAGFMAGAGAMSLAG